MRSALRRLGRFGYIRCTKTFVGRRSKSTYAITRAGRRALLGYLEAMQKIIEAVGTRDELYGWAAGRCLG